MSDIDTTKVYSQLGLNHSKESNNQPNDQLGQAEFLELMTSQLKFQDPLKPMENGDFLGQMAQFGTVSGINELNSNFGNMSNSLQSNQALQASTLVGRQVMAPSDSGFLGASTPLSGAIELEQSASDVIITVKNANGQIVNRSSLGNQQAGLVEFEWDGLDEAGNRLAAGEYQISAEVNRGGSISAGSLFAVIDVESVSIGAGGQDLTLAVSGGREITMADVRKIL